MKKFVSILALFTALTLSPAVFAGVDASCHFHGNAAVKESVVVGCATQHKDGLITRGKLDASWKGVKLEKAEVVEGKKMKEWKLTFNNPAEKDAAKKTLFMFYALTGNLIGANFTGQ